MTARVATQGRWGVRADRRSAPSAAAFWHQSAAIWTELIEFCDEHAVTPVVYCGSESISFEWYGPRRQGFAGDTVPPMEVIREVFDEVVDRLKEHDAEAR